MAITKTFTDQSTPGPSGPITAWNWDFGDGGSSTSENPTHSYATAGTYSVTLTVTGTGADGTAQVTLPVAVTSPPAIAAAFTAFASDLTVDFTDESTPGPSGPITGWSWNFGDSDTSTSQNPSHTYASAGTYTVTLTVTGTSPDGTANISHSETVVGASGGSLQTAMYTSALSSSTQSSGQVCNKNTALATQGQFAKLETVRIFNSGLPSTCETGNGTGVHAAGFGMIYSCKPPITPTSAGNTALTALVQTLDTSTDWFTTWHEPENDMTGAQFKTMMKNTCDIAHAHAPGLRTGYCAMAYQWRPGMASSATPDAWYDASYDFLAIDVYFQPWEFPTGGAPGNLTLPNNAGFMRWYNWAKTKGKPLLVFELGFARDYTASARATAIDNASQWLSDNGFDLVSHWNADSADPYNYAVWGGSFGSNSGMNTVLNTWFAKNP